MDITLARSRMMPPLQTHARSLAPPPPPPPRPLHMWNNLMHEALEQLNVTTWFTSPLILFMPCSFSSALCSQPVANVVPVGGWFGAGGVGGDVAGLQEGAGNLVDQRPVRNGLGHAVDGTLSRQKGTPVHGTRRDKNRQIPVHSTRQADKTHFFDGVMPCFLSSYNGTFEC